MLVFSRYKQRSLETYCVGEKIFELGMLWMEKYIGWLLDAAKLVASDVHLVAGYPPTRREHGELLRICKQVLSSSDIELCLRSICTPEQHDVFVRERNLDFAFMLDSNGELQKHGCTQDGGQRFRGNLFYSSGSPGACIRVIPSRIPELEENNFPTDLAERLASYRNGLIIFSGVSGSGKTTSMAMLLNAIAKQGGKRVITIEDPVEYLFPYDGNSIITQREVGGDVECFASGLRHALRQDPDIILVGEIRDAETARIAMSAAETGHLVISTLHSRDAKGAITRMWDLFPTAQQNETQTMLAASLRGVICQHLLPSSIPGERRELALEVVLRNNAVAAGVRAGRIDTLETAILAGRKDGMVSLDDSLGELLRQGRITQETAFQFATDPRQLSRM